jgi:hypothetical protein
MLKVGDVVRLSHNKNAKCFRKTYGNVSMTVVRIVPRYQGKHDGLDRVYVAFNLKASSFRGAAFVKMSFQRRCLWSTGTNIYTQGKSFEVYKGLKLTPPTASAGVPKTQATWHTLLGINNNPPAKNSLPAAQDPIATQPQAQPQPQRKEAPCPSCKKMNDLGEVKCWWCEGQL